MLVAALLQYNSTSASFDTNVRFRWEFKPGSDLFIVFSDGRHTDAPTSLQNRTFAVKIVDCCGSNRAPGAPTQS
jgi:hypothetical protein